MTKIYKIENFEFKVNIEILKKQILFDFFEWTNERLQEMIDEDGLDETAKKLGKTGYEFNITINGKQYERSTRLNPYHGEVEIEPIKIVLDKGDGYESLGSYITFNFEDNDDELQSEIVYHKSITGLHNGEPDHFIHSYWDRTALQEGINLI